jgi:PPM family protein phosphatase
MPEWFWIGLTALLAGAAVLVYTRTGRESKDESSSERPERAPPRKAAERDAAKKTKEKAPPADAPKSPSPPPAAPVAAPEVPTLSYEEDESIDPTRVGAAAAVKKPVIQAPTKRILYDDDAASDEPTHPGALIIISATAQTDRGQRRKRNEDSLLAMPENGVFVVADGMGGYSGGDIASALAVDTIKEAVRTGNYEGEPHDSIPTRASEMARALQMANTAVFERAQGDKKLEGMGTTICAALFSPNKQRLYVAHVGDSRMYRLRGGALTQMTSDHTMKDFGMTGPGSDHLSRAVGIWPTVPIDILLAKPRPKDLYILCSDGLTKMVRDKEIERIAASENAPDKIVDALIGSANAGGGKDNITVIVIRVLDPLTLDGRANEKPAS